MDGKATVLKLSIFSFLLASAGSSHNNIISYIFENLDLPRLGPAALLCRYLSYSASTLLAPSLKFKLKYQFLLVSALYCLNFFLGIIATNITEPSIVYWIICGGYILEGFASGINWVAEGRYLHLICEIFNIHKNRGHILGLHQFVRCCSLLGGAVITYLCIGFFNNTIYFCTLLIFGIISMIYAFYAIKEVDEVGRSELEAIEREGGNE
jgi:hypothetical protein